MTVATPPHRPAASPPAELQALIKEARRRQRLRRLALLALALVAAGVGAGSYFAFASGRTPSAGGGRSSSVLVGNLLRHSYIAYECENSLCLAHSDGSAHRWLLSGPLPLSQGDPAFAPDGRRIAFSGWYGSGDGAYALYVANTDGCSVHRLTRYIAGNPSWSPDGRWIAFDRSGFAEIWKVHPDGSGLTRIASGAGASSPAWSPDGRRIAFTRVVHGQGQVWVMRPDGSGARLLHTDVFASDQEPPPTWSHDGRKLAFVAMPSLKRSEIKVVNSDGSNVRVVTKKFAFAWNPVWLLHDAGVAFLARRGRGFGPAKLFVTRRDGSQPRSIGVRLQTEQFALTNSRMPARSC